MSRCFPFPPPGYESKARPDNVNLIIEEKHKQKKHKHKKDKDKKERSERKEKERSEGKHKEDKKRKRKKDKKKDKQSSSEEKRIVGSLENQNGGKLAPDSKPSDGIQDQRTSSILGKRVRNDGGTNQMVQKITFVEKKMANLPVKVHENGNGINDKREHIRMANGHGLRDDARSLGNGSVGNCNGEIKIKFEGTSLQVEKVEKRKEAEEKNVFGEGDGGKKKKRDKNTKAEDKRRKKEKKKEKMSKEKIKQEMTDGIIQDLRPNNHSDLDKESHDCQGKLPKLKELNGFLHANGIRPNNMSSSALPCHQAVQNGNVFRPSQNIINLAAENVGVTTNLKVNGKLSSPKPVIKNVRKTEPCQTANNSIAKHVSFSFNNHGPRNGLTSSHLVPIEKKMEPCQANNGPDEKLPPFENGEKKTMQWPDALHKTDKKELTKNGTLDGKKHTSSRSSEAKEKKGGTSMKPPHPDLKYLSQILTVPQVEWPQCDDDDQEWLFGCKDTQTKRPKPTSSQIHKQVWSEAMQLESADVIAMPYVIPY